MKLQLTREISRRVNEAPARAKLIEEHARIAVRFFANASTEQSAWSQRNVSVHRVQRRRLSPRLRTTP